MKRYIVWNKDHTEGVVFADYGDAKSAMTGVFPPVCSTLADAFYDIVDGETASDIQEVDL